MSKKVSPPYVVGNSQPNGSSPATLYMQRRNDLLENHLETIVNEVKKTTTVSDQVFKTLVAYIRGLDRRFFDHNKTLKDAIASVVRGFLGYLREESEQSWNIHSTIRDRIMSGEEPQESRNLFDYTSPGDRQFQLKPGTDVQSVAIVNLFGTKTGYDIRRLLNPQSLEVDYNMLLDSFNRDDTSNNLRRLLWTVVEDYSVRNGSVNVIGVIKNVLSMRVGVFYIPLTDANQYHVQDYRTVSMLIEEFRQQGTIVSNDWTYNFMFDAEIVGNRVKLTPQKDGYYKFNKPITILNTLTISFAYPFDQFNFESDRGTVSSFTLGASTTFVMTSAHNLNTGDIVYIKDMGTHITNTASAGTISTITLAGADLQAANYYQGWQVTIMSGPGTGQTRNVVSYTNPGNVASVSPDWDVAPDGTSTYSLTINSLNANTMYDLNRNQGLNITVLTATSFTVPVDTSSFTATSTLDTTRSYILYGSKRISIPLTFTCLKAEG